MSRVLLLLGATALATSPLAAQHSGHDPHAGHVMPAKKPPAKKPAAKKPATKKPVAKKSAAKKPTAKKAAKKAAPRKVTPKRAPKRTAATREPNEPAADPHAGHAIPSARASDPHAGHAIPSARASDPHAGHAMPPAPSPIDPHAGHDMSGTAVEVPAGPPPAEALQGPENAAEIPSGRAAMEPSRAVLFREHGDMPAYKILFDQLEARVRSGRDGYFIDAEGWYGGDIDKLWLKTEIEGEFASQPEQAEVQALWSHAIDPWFDLQTGVRFDLEPNARGHLAVGLQGLAPYWIEVEAAAFVSDKGDVTGSAEVEHDVRITRALVLQPRAELNFSLQDIPRRAVGAGLSTAELGLRLRYEIVPNLAPYVGLHYERAFSRTRRFVRTEGDDPDSWQFVLGLRTWF